MSAFVFLITNFGQVGFVFVFWLTANLPDPFVFEFRLYVSPGEYWLFGCAVPGAGP